MDLEVAPVDLEGLLNVEEVQSRQLQQGEQQRDEAAKGGIVACLSEVNRCSKCAQLTNPLSSSVRHP